MCLHRPSKRLHPSTFLPAPSPKTTATHDGHVSCLSPCENFYEQPGSFHRQSNAWQGRTTTMQLWYFLKLPYCDNSSGGSNQSDILSDDNIVPAFAIFLLDGSSDIPCSQSTCEIQFNDMRSSLSQQSQQLGTSQLKPWKSTFLSQPINLAIIIDPMLSQPSYHILGSDPT